MNIGDTTKFERNGKQYSGTVVAVDTQPGINNDNIIYRVEAPNENAPEYPIKHEVRRLGPTKRYQCKLSNGSLPVCPLATDVCHSPCDIVARSYGEGFSYPANVANRPD